MLCIEECHLVKDLQDNSRKRPSDKSCHTWALHLVIKADLCIIHVAGDGMNVRASDVALCSHDAYASRSVKSARHGVTAKTNPVGAIRISVYRIGMNTVIQNDNVLLARALEAHNVDSSVKLAYRMINIRIVYRWAGAGCAVLHSVSAYV